MGDILKPCPFCAEKADRKRVKEREHRKKKRQQTERRTDDNI